MAVAVYSSQRSSPADGAKNLHRSFFVSFLYNWSFQFPNLLCGRIFRSNLSRNRRTAKGKARTNTAYSGSLDAKAIERTFNRIILRTIHYSIVQEEERSDALSNNRAFGRTIARFLDISNNRTIDMSNSRIVERYPLPFSLIWNEPTPHLITAITPLSSFVCLPIPCISPPLGTMRPSVYFCARNKWQRTVF